MRYSNIPSVSIKEKELYQKNISLDTFSTIGFLTSDFGPARVETLVTDEDDLISIFGEPNDYNYKFWWAAWNYLQYGSSLTLIRPLSNDAENYSLKFNGNLVPDISNYKGLYNESLALMTLFQYNLSNYKIEVFNKYVSKKDDIAIAICSSEENFTKTISDEKLEHIIRNKDVSIPPNNPINGEKFSILKEKYSIYGIKDSETLTLVGDQKHISKNEKVQIKSFKTDSWVLSTNYLVGDLIVPSTENDFIYECTIAGKSGTVEPTWTISINDSFNDGDVTWICKSKDYRFDGYYDIFRSEYFTSENNTNLILNQTPSQLTDLLTNISTANTYDVELTQPSGNEIGNDGWKVFLREEGVLNTVFENKTNNKVVWNDFGNLTISINEFLTATTIKFDTIEDLSVIPTDGSASIIISGSSTNDGYYFVSAVDNTLKILTFSEANFSVNQNILGNSLGYWVFTDLSQTSGDFVKISKNNIIKQYINSNFGWVNVLENINVEYLFGDFNSFIDNGDNIDDYDVLEYQDGWKYYNNSHITENYTTYIELLSSAFEFNFENKLWTKLDEMYYSVDENNDGIGEFAVNVIYTSNIYSINRNVRTFKDLVISTPDWDNEFAILIFKKDANNLFNLEEKFICSYDSVKKDFNGKSKFAEDLINGISENIYIKIGDGNIVETFDKNIESLIIKDNSLNDYSNVNEYSLMNEVASEMLEDGNLIDGSILLGFSTNNNGISDMSIMPRIANIRENAVCILTPWEEEEYLNLSTDQMTEKLISDFGVKYFGGKVSDYSSYLAVYGNMKLQKDKFSGKSIWIPLIGDIAGIYTRNDRDYDYSLAPAGSERSIIQNISTLLFNPLATSQSKLEYEGINSIVFDKSTRNFILNSALTSAPIYESIFRELHVRRLMIRLKSDLNPYFQKILFKNNTDDLRDDVVNELDQYFDEKIEGNKIQEYLVICDTRNNTYEVINSKTLAVDIMIRPFKMIKKIKINVSAIQNTLTFSEDEFL